MSNHGLNEFEAVGTVKRAPELRYTPSGVAVVNFGVALPNDHNKGVAYMTVNAWEDAAIDIADNMQEGDEFSGTVRIQTRTYENKQGHTVWVTELVVCGEYSYGEQEQTTPTKPTKSKATGNRSGGNGTNRGKSPRR